MNSGIFPNRNVDRRSTLRSCLCTARELPTDVRNWKQAKRWFNFGTLEVRDGANSRPRVINTAGKSRFALSLSPR